MGESYIMTGDLKKAGQMQENAIADMQYLQEQLGQVPGHSSTDEPGEPAPEVVAAQKQMASCKFAYVCLLYTSPSPRDRTRSRMPSSA